jgi:regulator of sirC expression with transglutaminase-like and TPR domain
MRCSGSHAIAALVLLGCSWSLQASDDPKPSAPRPKTVEQVAEAARKSLAVITFAGRDGKRQGLGTGFVVGADGLIATNLHVIGEARPITVELPHGKRYEVSAIHASDRARDLAVLRIDARNLVPLELGDSAQLKDGQSIVALGNPLGLTASVVSGVVSAQREIEGKPMIQVALPVEPGNSGGPILDLQGRVQGLLTMKSSITANLGFAVPINALKPLLAKPSPIPMSHWLTIGALDPADWKPVFGAHWKQRAGRILVEGQGRGFGGRSLCLWQQALPALPFEVAVTVKLDDEAGAAGLIFHADGGDRHYGFYPSGGQLRLTRFDGPDVFSWTILAQKPSSAYRPGDWNTLKVHLEKDRFRCYVNNQLVVESTDTELENGAVGLAKFRDTRAEFKQFQVAREIPTVALPDAVQKRIDKSIQGLSLQDALKPDLVDALVPDAPASVTVLRDRAAHLEKQAARLRELAVAVHQKEVQAELVKALRPKEDDIDLVYAALIVARLDNDELDVAAYRKEVERMAREITASLPKEADASARLAALNKYLFAEHGFHGSRSDYYNRANSYLNEVIDDREGIPLTLSLLYMELARRVGLKMVGIGLPGHFVVEYLPTKGKSQLLDVYEGGKVLSRAEARKRVEEFSGRSAREEDFERLTKRAMMVRLLRNLIGTTREEGNVQRALDYLDVILVIDHGAANERFMRAMGRMQTGNRQGALHDVEWLLDHHPDGVDTERVLQLRRILMQPER